MITKGVSTEQVAGNTVIHGIMPWAMSPAKLT